MPTSSECASSQIFNNIMLADQENEYKTNITTTINENQKKGDDNLPITYSCVENIRNMRLLFLTLFLFLKDELVNIRLLLPSIIL